MPIATTNPATGKVERTFEEISDEEVERILAQAASTFRTYRTTTFAERGGWMVRAAEILENEVDRIATMMTTEMGKTLVAARAEVLKCATACRYFADTPNRSWSTSRPTRRPWARSTPTRPGSPSVRCWP